MAVSVGDNIPDVEVRVLGDDGAPTTVQTGDVLGTRQGRSVCSPWCIHPRLFQASHAWFRAERG